MEGGFDHTVAANYGDNAFDDKTGGYDLGGTAGAGYTRNLSGGRYFTFQLLSAMFGGSADKYLPMSAINGMRIIMSMENPLGAFTVNGLGNTGAAIPNISVRIGDPTFYLNMVRVDPTVDAQLLSAATGADGNIRVHSQSYSCFQNAIPGGSTAWEYIVPIRVSSLKAVYFTFAGQTNNGYETLAREAKKSALAATSTINAVVGKVMKTTWYQNNLQSYQFFIDGKPTPASPVQVRQGFSENIAELQRALHFGHKSGDGQYMSLLCDAGLGNFKHQNFILGQEFESFSNKGPVIESGMNTLNSLVTLRLNFDPTALNAGGVLFGSDACYLKVFCLYDTFLTITPATGIMSTEN
jgi:hypothetical protein